MKKYAVTLIMVVLSACPALPQARTKAKAATAKPEQPLFSIGISDEEMIALLGKPPQYLALTSQRHISPQEYPIVCTAEACRPIYERKTARNEYEIIIFESADESQSHLHPVLRVKEVRFELDKDMAPAEALLDIAEARHACKGDWNLRAEPMFMDISATCPGSGVQFKMFTHDMKAPSDAATPISRISMILAE